MTDYQRIEQVLKFLDMTARSLAFAIGLKSPQIFYDIKAGKCGISKSLAENIQEQFLNISAAWLLTGEGEMLKESSTKNDVLTPPIEKKDKKHGVRMIPFYDTETTGGYEGRVSSSNEEVSLKGYIDAGGWFDGRETAAIRHYGDSMIEYPNGCILAVKEVRNMNLLVPGRNYVIETDEYRVTKRVQKGRGPRSIALYSSNQEKYDDGRLIYEPFEIDVQDIRRVFSVLGYIVNQYGEAQLIRI